MTDTIKKTAKKTVTKKKIDVQEAYLNGPAPVNISYMKDFPSAHDAYYARETALSHALNIFKEPANVRDATPSNIINLANLFEKYMLNGFGSVAAPDQNKSVEAPKFG
jgi:hypothetical protein